jgi:succinyl-diaminopimelate desuccinylase
MTPTQTYVPERDDRRERLVETTLELLAFDTQNPPGETRQVFDWLERYITKLGIDFDRIETDHERPNLVVTIPGEREWTLLYEGHLDTVPYDRDCWSHDPLGERVDDRLYGRGATDMKGAIAAMLETMREFANETPPVTLQFAFVSDEETGGDAGIDAVLDTDAITADAAVVGETTTVDDEYAIALADKGRLWLTLEATGHAAHGSRPMCGENAVDRLYSVVADCRESVTGDRLNYPEPVGRIVDESVEYYKRRYADERLAPRELFEYPTANLGRLVGGSTVNSVPQSATAELDVRFTPGVSAREMLDGFRSCIDAREGVEIADVSYESGTYVDPDHPLVDSVGAAGRELADGRVSRYCATGGGDAKKLRAAGVPAVECAVGSDTAHAVDEHVTIDALERTAEWYLRLPERLDNRGEPGL